MDDRPVMRIMGIDPGLSFTGYGVVETDAAGRLRHILNGTIPTSSRTPFVDRLSRIHRELHTVISEQQPHQVAVEEVFFAKNPKSALLLGHARGVAILSAAMAGLPVFEYSATETKKAVCTYGRAGKDQVTAMVKALLRLQEDLSEHAADALALCICHVHSHRTRQTRADAERLHAQRRKARTLPNVRKKRKSSP